MLDLREDNTSDVSTYSGRQNDGINIPGKIPSDKSK